MTFSAIQNTDIYLLDQLFKGRIGKGTRILDAGCGYARNSEYFVRNDYDVFGVDMNPDAIEEARRNITQWNSRYPIDRYVVGDLSSIPHRDHFFGLVISSAVLHFAESREHFTKLFAEHVRVLASGGMLWIRMTTKHTLVDKAEHVGGDVYDLPDGTRRYLLDREYMEELMAVHGLDYIDPWKTVNVSDVRTMSVLALGRRQQLIEI